MTPQTRVTPDRAVLVGAFLAVFVYIQDLRYDFILDDFPLIALNDSVGSLRNWKMAFVADIFAMKGPAMPNEFMHYRPIFKLWQMLNAQLFGFIVPWWHLTSLLLHFAVVLLVYQLGIKLMKDRWTAALAALLFAFHPIHVESVAYISASTDILVALFALISLLAYIRFREQGASPLYFIASLLAAALAMMSKESAAIFPWLLVAYEALREAPPGTQLSWKRYCLTLPFFAVVGTYVVARTLLFGFNAGPGPGGSRIAALLEIPLVLVVYLYNLFLPFRLSFYYPSEWTSQWTLLKAAAVVLVITAVFSLWNRDRDRSGMRLQILWAAILFAPAALDVSVFVRGDWIHDRHMYLASLPICLIAAALLTDPSWWPKKASVIATSAVMAVLLIDTAIQVPRFTDSITIYSSALKVAPHSFVLHSFYAGGLWSYGRHEESLRELKICTELVPESAEAHEHFGAALAEIGREDEALAEYEKGLQWSIRRSTPFRAYLLSKVAQIELKRSEFPEAADHLREAVQIAPETLNYHSMLAQALRQQGRTDEADEEMRLEASVRQRVVQELLPSKD